MIKTIINEKDINKADVVILTAPYEKTASSHKGTVYGPDKVLKCLNTQIEFLDRDFKVEVNNFIKTSTKNLDISKLTPEKANETIRENCEDLLNKNKFIFLLGGEHAVSIGYFQALAKKYKSKDITIVQIDAHCDLRTDDSDYSDTPSNLAHSTVMRHASTLGFPIVQVGIRTYSTEEYEFFSNKKNNITVFEWSDKIPKINDILKSIKTKYVYITIDVDGFDPTFMPGTGTPVQGGLEWYYGNNLIKQIINKKELVGADIVEVSPTSDSVLTEYGSAQLIYTILANKFRNKFK